MKSKNGLEASRKSYKFNFGNFVSFLQWPRILLITIITIVSVAVLLLLLPYIVRDQSSVEVRSAMFSGGCNIIFLASLLYIIAKMLAICTVIRQGIYVLLQYLYGRLQILFSALLRCIMVQCAWRNSSSGRVAFQRETMFLPVSSFLLIFTSS